MKTTVVMFGILTAVSMPALAQQNNPPRTEIASVGRGEIRVRPTRATVFFTVQEKAATAAEAASANGKSVASTMRSLASAGINPDNIMSTSYSVAPNYEFSQNTRKQDGFMASTGIRVDVARIDDVGKIIDAGLSGGATQVVSTQYSGDKMDDARRDALRNAVEQARRDAETMAAAAGGRLGRLLSLNNAGISTLPISASRDYGDFALSGVAGGVAAVRPGELNVVATANARWEFIANN